MCLVSRFACDARVMVDAISGLPVSGVRLLWRGPGIGSSGGQAGIASSISRSGGGWMGW